MTTDPPTVTCPGCAAKVYREYDTITNGAGEDLFHIPTQSEHDALVEHWDFCPGQLD